MKNLELTKEELSCIENSLIEYSMLLTKRLQMNDLGDIEKRTSTIDLKRTRALLNKGIF